MLVYSFECTHDHAPPWQLVKLPEYVDTLGARCLDGSPGSYFFAPATDPALARDWVIYIMGGGWCFDAADCYARSQWGLGSSRYWGGNMTVGGLLSRKKASAQARGAV